MNSYKIAVILPSRGLIFSETADELLQNLQGFDYDIFFSHGLSIPNCFEKPLQKALRGSYTHIWFVEDDMILPPDTLKNLLEADVPVVTCDYPVSKEGQGVVFANKEKQIIFTGTGCLLVKREVFDELNAPYFRSDILWNAVNHGDFIRLTANVVQNSSLEGYGLHDVTFGIKLWAKQIPISQIGMIGQRKLIALGQVGSNDGAHQIEEWTHVEPGFLFEKLAGNPVVPVGNLVTVQTVSGELTVHPDKAKSLIKAGIATKIPIRSVEIDYNEVDI